MQIIIIIIIIIIKHYSVKQDGDAHMGRARLVKSRSETAWDYLVNDGYPNNYIKKAWLWLYGYFGAGAAWYIWGPKAKINHLVWDVKLLLINMNYVEFFLFLKNFIDRKNLTKFFILVDVVNWY